MPVADGESEALNCAEDSSSMSVTVDRSGAGADAVDVVGPEGSDGSLDRHPARSGSRKAAARRVLIAVPTLGRYFGVVGPRNPVQSLLGRRLPRLKAPRARRAVAAHGPPNL